MVGRHGGRQFHDDLATSHSGTSLGGKRRLIWGEGSTARISNELRPPDPGGGVQLTAPRDKMCEGHVSIPLPQGFVKRPVSQLAGSQLTRQFDRQPIEAVKVCAVLFDAIPEPVDGPVRASLAGADDDTNRMSPLTRQAVLEGDLSMEEEVVVQLNFCNSVIGGPTSAFHRCTDGIVDFAEDVILVLSSPADLAGDITVGVSSPADLAGDVTVSDIVLRTIENSLMSQNPRWPTQHQNNAIFFIRQILILLYLIDNILTLIDAGEQLLARLVQFSCYIRFKMAANRPILHTNLPT